MDDTTRAVELIDRYLERHANTDLEGVLALFAPDATLEDPVGTPPHRGAQAIRTFYRASHRRNGPLEIERVGPAIVCASQAAAHIRARFAQPADAPTVDVIYTFTLDGAGQIARLRAYFQT